MKKGHQEHQYYQDYILGHPTRTKTNQLFFLNLKKEKINYKKKIIRKFNLQYIT